MHLYVNVMDFCAGAVFSLRLGGGAVCVGGTVAVIISKPVHMGLQAPLDRSKFNQVQRSHVSIGKETSHVPRGCRVYSYANYAKSCRCVIFTVTETTCNTQHRYAESQYVPAHPEPPPPPHHPVGKGPADSSNYLK